MKETPSIEIDMQWRMHVELLEVEVCFEVREQWLGGHGPSK